MGRAEVANAGLRYLQSLVRIDLLVTLLRCMMQVTLDKPVHVIRFSKGTEHFFFMYHADQRWKLLVRLASWAMNRELDFTYLDALRIWKEVRDW